MEYGGWLVMSYTIHYAAPTLALGLHPVEANLWPEPDNLPVELSIAVDEERGEVLVRVIGDALVAHDGDELCRGVLLSEVVEVSAEEAALVDAVLVEEADYARALLGRLLLLLSVSLGLRRAGCARLGIHRARASLAPPVVLFLVLLLITTRPAGRVRLASLCDLSRVVRPCNGVHASEAAPRALPCERLEPLLPQAEEDALLLVALLAQAVGL